LTDPTHHPKQHPDPLSRIATVHFLDRQRDTQKHRPTDGLCKCSIPLSHMLTILIDSDVLIMQRGDTPSHLHSFLLWLEANEDIASKLLSLVHSTRSIVHNHCSGVGEDYRSGIDVNLPGYPFLIPSQPSRHCTTRVSPIPFPSLLSPSP